MDIKNDRVNWASLSTATGRHNNLTNDVSLKPVVNKANVDVI